MFLSRMEGGWLETASFCRPTLLRTCRIQKHSGVLHLLHQKLEDHASRRNSLLFSFVAPCCCVVHASTGGRNDNIVCDAFSSHTLLSHVRSINKQDILKLLLYRHRGICSNDHSPYVNHKISRMKRGSRCCSNPASSVSSTEHLPMRVRDSCTISQPRRRCQ
jgi:hypothetical protein